MDLDYHKFLINNKLNKFSSNKKIYKNIKKDYNDALSSSVYDKVKGYSETNLTFTKKINRSRKIKTNSIFCSFVKMNIRKKFFELVCLHFLKNNKLHKVFNRNRIKTSYSCFHILVCASHKDPFVASDFDRLYLKSYFDFYTSVKSNL